MLAIHLLCAVMFPRTTIFVFKEKCRRIKKSINKALASFPVTTNSTKECRRIMKTFSERNFFHSGNSDKLVNPKNQRLVVHAVLKLTYIFASRNIVWGVLVLLNESYFALTWRIAPADFWGTNRLWQVSIFIPSTIWMYKWRLHNAPGGDNVSISWNADKITVVELLIELLNHLHQRVLMAHNEKVFAMAGYSLNVPSGQMPYWKYFAEDNICSLIINVQPELNLSKDLLPIALPSSPAIANTHVVRSYIYFGR